MTRALVLVVVVAATVVTFQSVTGFGFLNWDDHDALVNNQALVASWPEVVRWAFTTTHMDHYQPLSWLAYRATGVPLSAARIHTLALVLHALNAGCLLWLTARLIHADRDRWWLAAATTLLFAVHPLRVETVAWTSALPYLLSYGPLLVAMGCWLRWVHEGDEQQRWLAVGLYAVSQLARVTAPLFPLVLGVVALASRMAPPRRPAEVWRATWPFAVIALPLAAMEAAARQAETLADIGFAPRLAWALTHPALYVWRSIAPGMASPLDVLPRVPVSNWGVALVATVATAVVVTATSSLRSRRVSVAMWGSYLALLVPVVGLLPSGLQVTADRYTYGPAMVLSLGLAAALAPSGPLVRRWVIVAAGGATIFFAQASMLRAGDWRDSLTLWSTAVRFDANNDVALYNLALARIEAGQPGAAIPELERLLVLVPDHGPGRAQLNTLVADREEAAGNAAAGERRFVAAVSAYSRALASDAARVRVRRKRGIALMETGRMDEAAADLAAAREAGDRDPSVAGALAFAWSSQGKHAAALDLLRDSLRLAPGDLALTGNLARLLVTAEPATLRNPEEALALAAQLNDRTGGSDVRVLDTLALALAATGRTRDAAEALGVAATLARDAGDAALAAAFDQRRAALPR
ncbi:MAG: tetratricopeptide repeat protein [Alphaproteobacteria bacterium]|nr:tetratricopeptide repeat protein [Alphaproteobacteria bacterium]MBM3809497.1 tetratricopeptide repeat protein [Acidimicrobiia bacterium]